MKTLYSPNHRLHHATELKDGLIKPCFEMPSRADTILNRVNAVCLGEVLEPFAFDRSRYSRVHGEGYVRFLENAWSEWTALGRTHDALPLVWPVRDLRTDREPKHIDGRLGFYAMDAGVAITSGTWAAVSASANLALTGMELIRRGERSAFALCRPPGHHAAANYMGGYCYLNNAAIAAQSAIDDGARRVVVLDVDYHHGNGTQSIFYGRSDVMFVSLHGDPEHSYPYFSGYRDETGDAEGRGFNHNYPLAHGTDWRGYAEALGHACGVIAAYAPDVLVVSLGVDTFKDDPISHFELANEDFTRIGEQIGRLGLPTLFVMEGGYMVDDIGVNAVNVLTGFEAA